MPAVTEDRSNEKIVMAGRVLEGKEGQMADGSSRAPGMPRDSRHDRGRRQRHMTIKRDRSREGGSAQLRRRVRGSTHTRPAPSNREEGSRGTRSQVVATNEQLGLCKKQGSREFPVLGCGCHATHGLDTSTDGGLETSRCDHVSKKKIGLPRDSLPGEWNGRGERQDKGRAAEGPCHRQDFREFLLRRPPACSAQEEGSRMRLCGVARDDHQGHHATVEEKSHGKGVKEPQRGRHERTVRPFTYECHRRNSRKMSDWKRWRDGCVSLL